MWQTAMQITELLQRVHEGDQHALQTVMPLVYDELKKLAAGHLRREGKARPLDTTALVHEAFLRLTHGQHPSYENRPHFYVTTESPWARKEVATPSCASVGCYFGGMNGSYLTTRPCRTGGGVLVALARGQMPLCYDDVL
jgi:hypothetical protein